MVIEALGSRAKEHPRCGPQVVRVLIRLRVHPSENNQLCLILGIARPLYRGNTGLVTVTLHVEAQPTVCILKENYGRTSDRSSRHRLLNQYFIPVLIRVASARPHL
jgi:hypothetical protein